jgi:Flp pilus assembly protein TadD
MGEGTSIGFLNSLLRRLWAKKDKETHQDWSERAQALSEAGDLQGLAIPCRRWTQAQPENASAYLHLGTAYHILGRNQEAVEALREALRLKPDFAEAWGNLALAYFLSGNRSAALEAVKELRRHDPQKADELFNLIMKP